ncbi:HAD family hydrolase [Myceligenerans pegani]|uniref:HAD hydrolase-like protein n=1 Tax=Myceligenerans pegani TaxID=2776917 RepID=A0ABR9N0Q1_9MICO|nr:HAD family hydrolase [Myceligenerans sp. TRM 65318]MBE1876653.1 HAD hydrolase-like protein [Myceligenerans sp. TRM 65318]MBE3018924.1 HAD hydrolase-like protein [Myceligenerans sp. TRM 65318]
MGPVSVLWCDFGGVLTPPVTDAAARVAAASGVPWPELARAADRVAGELGLRGRLAPLELGILSQREWAGRLTTHLTTVPRADLGRWDELWYADRPLDRAVVAELCRLSSRGIRIGLLTNSVAEWEPHRTRMLTGIDVFDAVVRSHEIGLAKPDPAIYRHADTILPAPAHTRTMLVDDDRDNCTAAVGHGWLALRHRTAVTTVTRLRDLVP